MSRSSFFLIIVALCLFCFSCESGMENQWQNTLGLVDDKDSTVTNESDSLSTIPPYVGDVFFKVVPDYVEFNRNEGFERTFVADVKFTLTSIIIRPLGLCNGFEAWHNEEYESVSCFKNDIFEYEQLSDTTFRFSIRPLEQNEELSFIQIHLDAVNRIEGMSFIYLIGKE